MLLSVMLFNILIKIIYFIRDWVEFCLLIFLNHFVHLTYESISSVNCHIHQKMIQSIQMNKPHNTITHNTTFIMVNTVEMMNTVEMYADLKISYNQLKQQLDENNEQNLTKITRLEKQVTDYCYKIRTQKTKDLYVCLMYVFVIFIYVIVLMLNIHPMMGLTVLMGGFSYMYSQYQKF